MDRLVEAFGKHALGIRKCAEMSVAVAHPGGSQPVRHDRSIGTLVQYKERNHSAARSLRSC